VSFYEEVVIRLHVKEWASFSLLLDIVEDTAMYGVPHRL
jgi:hypothetical protein